MSDVSVPELPGWLAAAFPFRRRVAEIGGHRVHWVDHGEGPAVLLVHGNPTWSFLWRKVIRALSASGYRVIAPDLVGFGLSDKPRRLSFHTVDTHVDIVTELVSRLELGSVVVAGQDWGGPIGCGVAERLDADGALRGLVLGNTAVLAAKRPVHATSFHRFAHLPIASEVAFVGLGFPLQWLPRIQGDRTSIGHNEARAYAFPFRRHRDRVGPLALARMVPHRDGHPSLPALDRIGAWVAGWKGPTALVWGVRDPVLGRALRRLAEALPHARVTETDAGHFLQEEVPQELCAAIRSLAGAG